MGWLAFCHCFVFIWNLPGQFRHFFFNSVVAFVDVVVGFVVRRGGVVWGCLFVSTVVFLIYPF